MPLTRASAVTGTQSGTSFPGSPATDDRFYRTDRRIEYFYDGTRWLSTQLFTGDTQVQQVDLPRTSSGGGLRCGNPWFNLYDIYMVDAAFYSNVSTASSWTVDLKKNKDSATGGDSVQLAAYTNTTNGQWTGSRQAVGAVVTKDWQFFETTFTENSGTASCYGACAFSYRLVG